MLQQAQHFPTLSRDVPYRHHLGVGFVGKEADYPLWLDFFIDLFTWEAKGLGVLLVLSVLLQGLLWLTS